MDSPSSIGHCRVKASARATTYPVPFFLIHMLSVALIAVLTKAVQVAGNHISRFSLVKSVEIIVCLEQNLYPSALQALESECDKLKGAILYLEMSTQSSLSGF